MKKIIILSLIIVVFLALFCACGKKSESVIISFDKPLYSVIFVDGNNNIISSQIIKEGNAAVAPEAPIHLGYTFYGWDKPFDNVTSNLTIKAMYTLNTYTVSFIDYDGTVLKTQSVANGSAASAPENPIREGYRFNGWDVRFDNVTSDITVKAEYIKAFRVTFLDYDGKVLKTQDVLYGESASAPQNPYRNGYIFDGWDSKFSYVRSDITVTATYKEPLIYVLNDDCQSYSVRNNGSTSDVYIPNTYNGLPVTSVGGFASSNITTISLPNSIISIEENAFMNCRQLENITIPNSVVSIGANAFSGCIKFSYVSIPSSVKSIGSDAFLDCINISFVEASDLESWFNIQFENRGANPLVNADYFYCDYELIIDLVVPEGVTSLSAITAGNKCFESVTLPKSITSIEAYSFAGWSELKRVVFSGSITTIGDNAFADCTNLEEIIIPDSVMTIGDKAFRRCKSLKRVKIGNSVTSLGFEAFASCESLEEIEIPNSVIKIGSYAFASCTSLKSVTIWSSCDPNENNNLFLNDTFSDCTNLKCVRFNKYFLAFVDTFAQCTNLTDFYYLGTMDQWNRRVTKFAYWDRETPDYTVHCFDGDVKKEK